MTSLMQTRNILLVLVVNLLASCVAWGEIGKVSCEQVGASRYVLTFTLDGDSRSVQVFASSRPDSSDLGQPVATATTGTIEVTAGKPGERVYFFLRPDHGRMQEVSLRRLPLQGAINFRDMGGYPTVDGRSVRWGELYRSNELGHLTEADLLYLKQLRVRLICDFRTEDERKRLADRWPDVPDTTMISNPIGARAANGSVSLNDFQHLLAQDPQPAKLQEAMISLYRELAIDGAPEFASALQQIVDGKIPFVYHCTAGKDRTGLFSAFVLRILDVAPASVREDYLLSNQYLLAPDALSQMQAMMHTAMPSMPPLNRKAAQILLGVDERYLAAAFAAIDQRYGSFDNYRRKALGISDQDVSSLRALLLTP